MCSSCETSEQLALYDLLPSFLRQKSDEMGGDVLRGITAALEGVGGLTQSDLEGLADLIDVDVVDSDFLIYLSSTLGELVGDQDDVPFQRFLIKNLVAFHKIKGTSPSWNLQFRWLLDFWMTTHELWKSIPAELGDYSQIKDYTHLIKSARFDLESPSGALSPKEAAPYAQYIDSIRPIHVLLRRYADHFVLSDNLGDVSDSFLMELQLGFSDMATGVGDYLTVQSCLNGCQTDCQTDCQASCQSFCEMACEADACEFACQASCEESGCEVQCQTGCQTGAEPECQNCQSGCEAGACEGGCEAGSCQTGCQSCDQIEIFPALVKSVDEDAGLKGRIFAPSADFPPDDLDPYWLNPDKEVGYVELTTNIVAGGSGSPVDSVLPLLKEDNWTHVRCVKGDKKIETHRTKGNGVRTYWTAGLKFPPHLCCVKIYATQPEQVGTASNAFITTGQHSVNVPGASDKYATGDTVRMESKAKGISENMIIRNVSADKISFKCGLKQTFRQSVSDPAPTVTKEKVEWVAHVSGMERETTVEVWNGVIKGYVDPEEDSTCDFRYGNSSSAEGGTFHIYWQEPPPVDAEITVEYVPEKDCTYTVLTDSQSIDPAFEVDAEGNLAISEPQRWKDKFRIQGGGGTGTIGKGHLLWFDGTKWVITDKTSKAYTLYYYNGAAVTYLDPPATIARDNLFLLKSDGFTYIQAPAALSMITSAADGTLSFLDPPATIRKDHLLLLNPTGYSYLDPPDPYEDDGSILLAKAAGLSWTKYILVPEGTLSDQMLIWQLDKWSLLDPPTQRSVRTYEGSTGWTTLAGNSVLVSENDFIKSITAPNDLDGDDYVLTLKSTGVFEFTKSNSVPDPPETGDYMLTSQGGVMSWVELSEFNCTQPT